MVSDLVLSWVHLIAPCAVACMCVSACAVGGGWGAGPLHYVIISDVLYSRLKVRVAGFDEVVRVKVLDAKSLPFCFVNSVLLFNGQESLRA